MRWRALAVSVTLIFTLFTPAKAAQTFENSFKATATPYWVDCSFNFRSQDCIDKIEFSDPRTEKFDADGALDYSSISWIAVTALKNSRYEYGKAPDTSKWTHDMFGGKNCEGHVNGDYQPDACYTATGLLPEGGDVTFHMQVATSSESVGIYQWVDKGVKTTWVREQENEAGDIIPEKSTWRITLKSDDVAKNLGWLTANGKNPVVDTFKGSDGIMRTTVQGTVYPAQYGCKIPNQPWSPGAPFGARCDDPNSYAETMSSGMAFELHPYLYQFEKLKGYTPGGIFVTGPAGSLGQVQYDQEIGVITVPMAGPHYLFDHTTLNKGWMEVSVKGDVIRKAFNLDPKIAGNFAKVDITYNQGQQEVATYTSRYVKSSDSFEIRAYNFHFSAPNIKVRMKDPKSSVKTPVIKANSKSTITCKKGKDSKKISGVKPSCPKGWTKV